MIRIRTQVKRFTEFAMIAGIVGIAGISAQAATTPFATDFDSDPVGNAAPAGFTEDVDDSWSIVDTGGGDHSYRANASGDQHAARPIVSTLDFGTSFAEDRTFSIYTDFTLNSFTDNGNASTAVGLGALGNNASFSGDYYLAHLFVGFPSSPDRVGKVQLYENGGDGQVNVLSSKQIDINSTDRFRLTLSGESQESGSLALSAQIENLSTYESASVSATDTVPLDGGHFGFRNALSSADADSSLDALFHTLSVTSEASSPNDVLESGLAPEDVEDRRYLSYVTEAAEVLMAEGADRYGEATDDHLLVSVMDVRSRDVVSPDVADEQWRTVRRGRRSPDGHNFLHDQDALRVLRTLSTLTGDEKYARFAADYTRSATALTDGNGMFWWGWHRHYDVRTDQKIENDGGYHEIHSITHPDWRYLLQTSPDATQLHIQQMWERHVVDKNTGEINRHDTGSPGRSFIMSGGAFIEAFAAMCAETGEQAWLDRAKLLADYNWTRRNPETNLLASTPNSDDRWDGSRATTTLPAFYAPSLLIAWQQTGDETFRDQALTYLKAYAQYGYDSQTETFRGSLQLDGTPVSGPRLSDGSYDQYEPRGAVDLWNPYVAGYEQPLAAAQAYAQAYALAGDETMLATANQWADLILANLPATQIRGDAWYAEYADEFAEHGAHAENYARGILFFVELFETTTDDVYLDGARQIANEAIANLWYEGVFRGHQAKPYYEAVDGVGLLMDSLVRLDQATIPEPTSSMLFLTIGIAVMCRRGKVSVQRPNTRVF